MILGLIIISLLLVVLKDCLSLDNSVTSVYAGKCNNVSYLYGTNGAYTNSSTEDSKVFDRVISCGNTFNNLAVNKAANATYSSIEEEYAAFHCCIA